MQLQTPCLVRKFLKPQCFQAQLSVKGITRYVMASCACLTSQEVCTSQPELWHKVAAFQGLCTHNARRQPCQMCTSETTNAGCKTGFAQLCAETACTCRWRLSSFWAFPKTSSTKRFCRASSISGPNAWMASFVFLSTCQALVSCACPAFQHVHIVLVPWKHLHNVQNAILLSPGVSEFRFPVSGYLNSNICFGVEKS